MYSAWAGKHDYTIELLDRQRHQLRVGDHATARVGIIVQIEREHRHEARQGFDARHDEGRRCQHDLAIAQAVAVDLRRGERGDEIVARLGAPALDLLGDESRNIGEGGDLLIVATALLLVGGNRKHNLAADFRRVGFGQA